MLTAAEGSQTSSVHNISCNEKREQCSQVPAKAPVVNLGPGYVPTPSPRSFIISGRCLLLLSNTETCLCFSSGTLTNQKQQRTHIGHVCSKSKTCKRQADPRNSLSAWNWSKLVHFLKLQSKFSVFLAGSIWLSTSRLTPIHTPSFAFRHPPSKLRHNWIRPTLRISAHLSTDVASAPVKVLGTTD